uniref:WAT1-related protein n=1 Tax=Nelumbo nucifera TaxID=4432 RepID=A0A822YU66_NELNU|nr:TPA_asm: hypothetical protein HUJ06_006717 [Nelumbo nucifera]
MHNSLETVDLKSKGGIGKVLGALVCVGGAMLLGLYKGVALTKPSNPQALTHANSLSPSKRAERWRNIGTLALVAGCTLWSSWFFIQARIGKQYPCQYSSTTFMSFFSALQSATLSLVVGGRDFSSWILSSKVEMLTVLYAGIMGSGLSFVGMSWCVKKRGPLFTAAFSPLIQVVVAMFDFSILNEQLHLGSVLGSVLVIVGLYTLLWGKSKDAQNCAIKQPQAPDDQEQEYQEQPV